MSDIGDYDANRIRVIPKPTEPDWREYKRYERIDFGDGDGPQLVCVFHLRFDANKAGPMFR